MIAFHIDRHKVFLAGVKSTLVRLLPNITVHSFTNEQTMWDFLKEVKPDIILADLNATNRDSIIGFYRDIKYLDPKIHVILLTMYPSDHAIIIEGLRDRVFDFCLLKSVPEIELVNLIKKLGS